MSDNIAIRVQNLSKVYKLYDSPRDRFKETFHPFRKKYHHDFYALRDINFDVRKGETVGIIGKNGSGKSTLLKILTGVLTPTSGIVEVSGKISALLELGAGFNPEFTGIQNVYLSGTIMGYTREDMDARLDDILSFADIGEFVHQPVKMYSSGMYVRLAFAVALTVNPEILIVDEALSVGDMNFQAKSMTAMHRKMTEGTTVVFVSHDVGSVKSLCSRGIYLEGGEIKQIGNAANVAELYIKDMREQMNEEHRKFLRISDSFNPINDDVTNEKDSAVAIKPADAFKYNPDFLPDGKVYRYGSGGTRITCVEMLDANGGIVLETEFNQDVIINIYVECQKEMAVTVNYHIVDDKKISIIGCNMFQAGRDLISVHPGDRYIVSYRVRLPLKDGVYSIMALITMPIIKSQSAEFIDVINDAYVFRMNMNADWRIWTKAFVDNKLEITRISNN
jgi:lipopolysaccharide transport system ATP-binding protein